MKWKKYFICSLAFLPVLFSFIFSSPVNAANISNFSVNVATGGNYHWQSGLSWGQSFDANYIRRIEPHFTYSGTPSGNYGALSSTFNLVSKYCFSDGQTTRLINPNTIVLEQIAVNGAMVTIEEKSVTYSITDWTTSENINNIQTTCHNRTFTFYVSATFTNFSAGSNPSILFTIGSDTAFLYTPDYSSNYNYFYFEDDSNNQTNVAFDNNVNNALLQTQVNQNQQIIQNQQATTDAVNNLNTTIEEQQQQQQDQYDEEKQEESEREESGNESADEMSGIFNFSIVNPFYALFQGFQPGDTCVSIPTIASMVGSDETQFCPWFPASVRNVLTPVLTLSSMILLFGFLINWLRSDSSPIPGSVYSKQGKLF